MSIKWALFAAFSALVVISGAISFVFGYSLVSDAVIMEAQRRVELDLRSAWVQYDHELERVRSFVNMTALFQKTRDMLSGKEIDYDWVRMRLEEIRKQHNIDVLTLVEKSGRVVLRTRFPYNRGDSVYTDAVISRVLKGKQSSGTVIIPAEVLELEGQFLKEQAFMEIKETPMAVPTDKKFESSGMMLKAAEPVYDDSNQLIGFVYGGVMLNRNYAVPDAIRDTIFRDERYNDKPIGTVTIFQWDLRISTNVLNLDGTRAIGTRLSRAVYEKTLENGKSYYDRAFVVNDWFLTAYDPIKDPDGRIIGILYVGMLEAKYLDYKDRLVTASIGLIILGAFIALFLAFAFATWLSKPVAFLTKISTELSAGNYNIQFADKKMLFDEIELLYSTFKTMSDNIIRRSNELSAANRSLNKSNEELMQLNQNYMDMLEFVTHELKSPLASMIFGLNSLKDGYLGEIKEEHRNILKSIEKNADYLNEMILNYLNLSRIEKDELQFIPKQLFIKRDLIEPVIGQISQQLAAADMKVEVAVPDDASLFGDPNLLRIVFDNLISNGVKYGKRGTVIKIGYKNELGKHTLNVFNEGIGIAEKDIGKLFMKFSRLDAPELKLKKGTGLGLFITRKIVEGHGGRIWVESKEGNWANFIFQLPSNPPLN